MKRFYNIIIFVCEVNDNLHYLFIKAGFLLIKLPNLLLLHLAK